MNIDCAVGRLQEVMWFTDNAINVENDEVAVEHLSIATSLIRTCRSRGNNPYTSILDGPRRFETHPGSTVKKCRGMFGKPCLLTNRSVLIWRSLRQIKLYRKMSPFER